MIGAKIDLETYQQSLVSAEKEGDLSSIGQAKINLGMALFSMGRFDDALRIVSEAIELARQENDNTSLASYIGKQGVILFESGNFIKAQQCFLMVLELAGKIENDAYKCDALGNLGLIFASTGNPVGSMEKLNEALAIARQMGDHSRELTQLGNIGHTYLQVANIDDAIKTYTLAVRLAQKIGDRQAEAGYLNNLGVVYNNISLRDPLIKTFEQVLAISGEIKDKNLKFNALQHLAKAQFALGDSKLAIKYARQALEILDEMDSQIDRTAIRDVLIPSLIKEEHFTEAIEEIKAELEKVRLGKDKNRELILLGQMTDTYFQSGNLDQSMSVCINALNLAVRLQKKFLEGRLAGRLSAIYADLGEIELSNQYIDRAIKLAETEKDLQNLAEQYYLRTLNCQQTGLIREAVNSCHQSIDIFLKTGLANQTIQAQKLLTELQPA